MDEKPRGCDYLEAAYYLEASYAANTKHAYESDLRVFVNWCNSRNLQALPATTHTIGMYLADIAGTKAVATIVRAATAINAAHEFSGNGTIWCPELRMLLRGIRRKNNRTTRQAKGISFVELTRMVLHCDSTIIGARDKALLLIGWCSALRRTELVGLNINDIEFRDEGVILNVRRSKTDQDGISRKIGIPNSSQLNICPVVALKNWVKRWKSNSNYLGCKVEKPEPLFKRVGMTAYKNWFPNSFVDTGRLSDRSVSLIVKKYAGLAKLSQGPYSAHSLRRGLATEAASRLVPDRIIARHTGHASLESLRGYIEDGTVWIDNPLLAIYSPSPSPGPLPELTE